MSFGRGMVWWRWTDVGWGSYCVVLRMVLDLVGDMAVRFK